MASIEKRGDNFRIIVSCGYDANGKKIKKSTTFKPKKNLNDKQKRSAAEAYAVQFEASVNNGNIAETHRTKLCDFVPEYFEVHGAKLSPLSRTMYERVLTNLIVPNLGHMKLKDIKPIHVQRFLTEIQKPDADGNTISPSTVRRYLTVLKSVMGTAYKLGYTDINPTETARLDLPEMNEADTDIFSKEEAAVMLKALSSEPLRYQCLIHVALVTGCRRGELVGLQWKHIDFEEGIISIEQSNYRDKDGTIKTKTPKTKGSIRKVAIPQYLVRMLKDYKRAEKKEPYGSHILWNTEGWVFSQWDGSPMSPDTPSHWFNKFQKKHDIPHHKFHSLRHSSASIALADGVNIKTVASRLGHSQLKTTNRYLHSLESADREAANNFEALVQAVN